MTQSDRFIFEIIDTESLESRRVAAAYSGKGPAHWKVGIPGSGAHIEVAEPLLDGIDLFVFGGSNHLILMGTISEGTPLPVLGIGDRSEQDTWTWTDPMRYPLALRDNKLYVRFDYHWLRIGKYALRLLGI